MGQFFRANLSLYTHTYEKIMKKQENWQKIEVYKSCIRNHLWKKVGRRILYLGAIFNT